jgi:peptidyl-prolyl cis-trans isomerase D
MLRVLRENAQSWMLRGILILVAVTFISWGGYSLIRERNKTYAAKVNGVTIEWNDFNDAYQNTVKQYRDALGPSFSEKMIEEMKLPERVLDELISKVLMMQEAKRLGLTVSDDELRASIESLPTFQLEGQFDRRMYERALRLNRLTPEQFEQMQRENIVLTKLVALVRFNGGKISEDEVLETFRFENERVNLAFLKVSPDSFKGQVTVNDIEEKDYYQKNQEEFRISASVQVQYLVFRPSDIEGKSQVSPDDVKRTYDSQMERYKVPKRVKAREILVKVGPEDTADKIDEKRKKAEDLLEKARKTKDFASLAKQSSESETASKGGDLGWVQAGAVDELIQTALFSLKPGEISGVVKGIAGFTILKADEVTEGKQKSLDEVKDQILQTLKKEKAKAEASRRADDAFYALFRNRDLETYAKEKNVPIKTTGFFKEDDEIPEIGRNPLFASSAFSLKTGEISPVVSIPPNFYIVKLLDKKDSRISPLDDVKGEVRRKVVAIKCDEMARKAAENLLKAVQGGKSLKEVAQEKGLPVDESGLFTRTAGAIPKIGPAGELMNILSPLTDKSPVPKEVLRTKDGYFVVRLSAVEPADQGKFQPAKQNLERRLTAQKQEGFFRNWLEHLKSGAKIDKNKDIVKG